MISHGTGGWEHFSAEHAGPEISIGSGHYNESNNSCFLIHSCDALNQKGNQRPNSLGTLKNWEKKLYSLL